MRFDIQRILLKKSRAGEDLDLWGRLQEGDGKLGRIYNRKKIGMIFEMKYIHKEVKNMGRC